MRAFPFATTISVLIGAGGLGAQQLLTGPKWEWLWPWVMWGGFGTALCLLLAAALLYFFGRAQRHDLASGAATVASGSQSAAVGGDNNGVIVAGNATVNVLRDDATVLWSAWDQQGLEYVRPRVKREDLIAALQEIERDYPQQ
ncbi:MAG: hypothetical protein J0J01_01095 [Reyranella sp.]|uniref:hypothetical protein n=1 Tax=Reyranella sp. TaxID=1929291 RepID=UPI001ACAC379|nr:hypothetical protein [Reyranella sp.]MBN9085475.1 hypothetical protein [Reyranella sp.]